MTQGKRRAIIQSYFSENDYAKLETYEASLQEERDDLPTITSTVQHRSVGPALNTDVMLHKGPDGTIGDLFVPLRRARHPRNVLKTLGESPVWNPVLTHTERSPRSLVQEAVGELESRPDAPEDVIRLLHDALSR